MSLEIRSFQNSDSKPCCDLWNTHFAASGLTIGLTPALWDYCVVDKVFFEYPNFFVAELDEVVVGLAHLTFGADSFKHSFDTGTGILNALCVAPHELQDFIASALIEQVIETARGAGASTLQALGSPHRYSQYLLVPPHLGMMGVLASDQRLQRWLAAASFQAVQPTDCWQVDLNSLRLPMDRGQMAVRRTSSIGRVLTDCCESWFLANAFGHAEQMRFSLTTRGEDRFTQEVVFLYLDAAYFPADRATAVLMLPTIPTDPLGIDQLTFLIAESLRQMQFERFSSVLAIAPADNQPAVQMLQRLSFRTLSSGVIYTRTI